MSVELGVCWASKVDDLDYVVLAEELGYTHLWAADSQMLWSDCYAAMALAAARTSRIRIGTGVAVAGTRPAAVTAAAHATINRIAPGRVFCGIGTGNTAMRLMGHKPIRLAEFDDHLATLRRLMDGEEADVSWRGAVAPARHLMPDAGFVGFHPRIPMYVSAFGPKATAVAGKHGDGLVVSIPPVPSAVAAVKARFLDGAAAAGRELDEARMTLCTLTTMVVLAEGESPDSDRVRAEAGAFAIAGLHYAYEQHRQYRRRPNPVFEPFWDDYVAMLEAVPEERRHLRVHAGHNCWVIPEEERFVTHELIEATCLVGTGEQLAARLRTLGEAGLTQVMLLPPLAVKEKVLRDVATAVMPLLA
jgi:alkanesulfonate monooxygenase SsuD/methylene tetrahydromethanopterin reductase-like flavin-dependent oxidoreductase (luciferase family)